MSDFKYIVPPDEPKIIRSPGEVGIAPTVTEPINNSCSFNGSTQYLSRTFTSTGSQTTATLSMWYKRGRISRTNYGDMLWHSYNTGAGPAPGNYNLMFVAGSSTGNTDTLVFNFRNGGSYYSNQVLRDPSAWYHIVVNWDSSNAAQSERFRFYINGVRGTFISAPTFALNYAWESAFNLAIPHIIGWYFFSADYYIDGYVAETHFIDGQALPPTAFATTSNRTNTWVPKRYLGTYGTTGFNLKFNNSAALGTDSSGNNNTWTLNNITSSNQTSDSPTNNYPTFNPIVPGHTGISNGNLTYTGAGGSRGITFESLPQSGRWYLEATIIAIGGSTERLSIFFSNIEYINTGNKRVDSVTSSYGSSYTTGDIIGIAIDFTTSTATFYKNNVSQGGIIFSTASSSIYFYAFNSSDVWSINFGQRAFSYTPPTGFRPLCSANLPIPNIRKPNQFFDARTYTGTGSTQSIVGFNFAPDFIWTKGRNLAQSHNLFDSLRPGYRLRSDSTAADASTTVTIDSNGFTLGTETENNNASSNFISWLWCAGSSTITNTAGSITSTIRVNPISKFSIVSFTNASGTNQETVGHGLGVVPKFIIVKNRDTTANNWAVFHSSVCDTTSKFLQLNTTNATTTFSTVWGASLPTSSVFGVTGGGVAAAGVKCIAYCFAEVDGYSRFGFYTGNASADGPFVYCGFRPRWVMIKRTDTASRPWCIHDTARDTSNVSNTEIEANATTIENGGTYPGDLDVLSNGFKLREGSTAWINESGGTYVFAAFAETPFKYANAR